MSPRKKLVHAGSGEQRTLLATGKKSRPNKIVIALSDASPLLRAKRTKRAPMNIGYARVSTTDQIAGLEAQQRDLKSRRRGEDLQRAHLQRSKAGEARRVPRLSPRGRCVDRHQTRQAGPL